MKTTATSYGFGDGGDVTPKLEGMQVEFDEKVTLFPVDLEEIRHAALKSTSRPSRAGRAMH